MQIRIEADVAAAMLDTAIELSGPISAEEAMMLMRQARFLVNEITEAFTLAGIDPDAVTRPEYPLLKPGSKYISEPGTAPH